MEKEKATIDDYARMCKSQEDCTKCPMAETIPRCHLFIEKHPDKANEIILKWCEEHPVETRQDKFLKMFPNAYTDSDGVIDIAPCTMEKGIYAMTAQSCTMSHKYTNCGQCRKEYWLAEVEE